MDSSSSLNEVVYEIAKLQTIKNQINKTLHPKHKSVWSEEENNILIDAWKNNKNLSEESKRTLRASQYHLSTLLIHELVQLSPDSVEYLCKKYNKTNQEILCAIDTLHRSANKNHHPSPILRRSIRLKIKALQQQ